MLLSSDVGHFSLVRALHLADLITLLNGMLGVDATRCARLGGGFLANLRIVVWV